VTVIFRAIRLAALLFALLAFYAGSASAAPGPCPNNGSTLQPNCTKEIQIWNNTDATIYVVLQGSIQVTDARNCPKSTTGGGDVWLQAAFGDYDHCYPVTNTYYVFVNPKSGIAKNSLASISVPWWSQTQPGAPDLYIDWWRAARVYIFDDQTALDDSYKKLTSASLVKFATQSPVVSCSTASGNQCLPAELQIYRIPSTIPQNEALYGAFTPYQLNEYTFADVSPLTDNDTSGGDFTDFNQGYNVSNVDQVYLPIAIEPVREPADIGYIGTTSPTATFRTTLANFTGPASNLTWPIYNNATKAGKPAYPNAGIRVPSTASLFTFYANPGLAPNGTPVIIPATPPKLVENLMSQWTACTTTGKDCPQSDIYNEINAVFEANYKQYIKAPNCTPPTYLQPVDNTGLPSQLAFLQFVYGWVPFNESCTGDLSVFDLPTVAEGNRSALDYIYLQYNYKDSALTETQWFNPYTQLIHAAPPDGLGASAYAFSIDDQASFVSNSGGSLPGGLIIAVGGPSGLPNPNPYPPPLPDYYQFFDFAVGLGGTPSMKTTWAKYGICSQDATIPFRPSPTGGYVFGVDPKLQTFPCTISLTDSVNNKYQITVAKAAVPPNPIWPFFCGKNCTGFDSTVVSCPSGSGLVPPAQWCNFTNETTDTAAHPAPIYSLSARAPLQPAL
jgi:hypothetical protein